MASYIEQKIIIINDLNERLKDTIIYTAGPEEDNLTTMPVSQSEDMERTKDKTSQTSPKKRLQKER